MTPAATSTSSWVAVSTKGTVVKINTETGQIIGEYFTSPNGQPAIRRVRLSTKRQRLEHEPRRQQRRAHRPGRERPVRRPQRQRRYRDSTGFNDIRPWTNAGSADTNGGVSTAADECIIHYTRVNSFGTRHVSVTTDNDIWVSGTSGSRFDLLDGITGASSELNAPWLRRLRWSDRSARRDLVGESDAALGHRKPLNGANGGTGAVQPSQLRPLYRQPRQRLEHLVWQQSIRKFSPDGTLIGSFDQGSPCAGLRRRSQRSCLGRTLAHRSTVGHLKNDGAFVGTITVGSGPTGVAVDGEGKVWATNYNSGTVSRIDPTCGSVGRTV